MAELTGGHTFSALPTKNSKVKPNNCLLCMTHRPIFPGEPVPDTGM